MKKNCMKLECRRTELRLNGNHVGIATLIEFPLSSIPPPHRYAVLIDIVTHIQIKIKLHLAGVSIIEGETVSCLGLCASVVNYMLHTHI